MGAEPHVNLETFCHQAGYHHISLLLLKMNKHCIKKKNKFSFTSLIVSFSNSPLKVGCWLFFGEIREMAKYPYSWPALRGRKAQDMQKMLGNVYFFLCFGTTCFSLQDSLGSSTPIWNSLTKSVNGWPTCVFPLACSVFGDELGVPWYPYLGKSTLAVIYLRA